MVLRALLLLAAFLAAATPASAAWHEAKTRHFIIYSDAGADDLRDYATKLERFDQAVRTSRNMADPPLTDSGRLTIYALKDVGELDRILGTGRSIFGFYVTRTSGSFAYVARKKATSKADLNSDIIFFHEYAHHLMFQNASAFYPTWLVEGFAEFLSTAVIGANGDVTLGAPANHRSTGIFAIDHDLTLSAMVGANDRRLTAWQWELTYAKGWLLTHYLTFEPSRRGQLDRYAAGIRSGLKPLDAAKAAFGDLRTLDRELDRYADRKTLSAIVVPTDSANIGPIAIRPMREAEAAITPVVMQSNFGVTSATAGRVAAHARKIAARFPGDPLVQSSLAEAEFDAENYAAAVAAADRALAADPNRVHALIYRGRALAELAAADPQSANWGEIRSWFIRANRADPENPEPMILFYRTFEAEGKTPTASAVKGLLYALVLAPQDGQLRLTAVRQLLVDRRIAEARQAFLPLAYDPHARGFRDPAQDILAAIDAGDSAKALALIDDWNEDNGGD